MFTVYLIYSWASEGSAASLSCAYSVVEKVGELTSSDEYMNRFLRTTFLRTTKAHYTSQSGKSPDDLHGNFMRKHQMVEAIYNRKFLRLLDQATPVEAARLQSLRTPHAAAWVTSPHPSTLSPPEFRSGLRWILGLPVQTRTSNCAVCGREADTTGVHYATCQKSGERSRGHTRLRNVVANALRAVAWNVETEKPLPPQVPLPTSTERLVPADVFIPGCDPPPRH